MRRDPFLQRCGIGRLRLLIRFASLDLESNSYTVAELLTASKWNPGEAGGKRMRLPTGSSGPSVTPRPSGTGSVSANSPRTTAAPMGDRTRPNCCRSRCCAGEEAEQDAALVPRLWRGRAARQLRRPLRSMLGARGLVRKMVRARPGVQRLPTPDTARSRGTEGALALTFGAEVV